MKQRKVKFSLGMKIASILACLALVSVGFASWWIVQFPEEKTIEDGQFVVYAVEEKNITFEDVHFVDNAEIVYGYTTPTTAPAYKWLGADKYDANSNPNGVKPEKLSATLQFKVVIDDEEANLDDYLTQINVDFDAGTAYEAAMVANNEYGGVVAVGAPIVSYRYTKAAAFNNEEFASAGTYTAADNLSFNFAPPTDAGDELLVEVKFTFSWGRTTNGQNPYEFFNQNQYTTDSALLANNFLNAVKKLNDGQAYIVKISTNPGR